MNEEIRAIRTVLVCMLIAMVLGIGGGLQCDRQRQAFKLECVKAGRTAAECLTMDGAHN